MRIGGREPSIPSANSGGTRNAFADDAESASVQLTTKFDADIHFGGAAEAGITANAGSGAFADSGGGTSDAAYEFRATSAELLTIDYKTQADVDPGTFVYEITIANIATADVAATNGSGGCSPFLNCHLTSDSVSPDDLLEAPCQAAETAFEWPGQARQAV